MVPGREPFIAQRSCISLDPRDLTGVVTLFSLGPVGGLIGALLFKSVRIWTHRVQQSHIIGRFPLLEVVLVALSTGLLCSWCRTLRLPTQQLLTKVTHSTGTPTSETPALVRELFADFAIQFFCTVIAIGISVPAGCLLPALTIGALFGQVVGLSINFLTLSRNPSILDSQDGYTALRSPDMYAIAAAGAVLCGTIRSPVTVSVLLYEWIGCRGFGLVAAGAVVLAQWTAAMVEEKSLYVSNAPLSHGAPSFRAMGTQLMKTKELLAEIRFHPSLE